MIRKIFTIFLMLLLTSCQKQSPGGVDPDYTDSLSEVRRGFACQKTNLTTDILEHENTKNLFVCTTWDKKFPELNKAIQGIPSESWNRFAHQLNVLIFNDRHLRDKLILLLQDLEKKNGLDELGKVITSLSDSNYYLHVNQLLNCAKDPQECSRGSRISEDELWSFFEFFKASPEIISSLSKIISGWATSFSGPGYTFKKSLRQNLKSPLFLKGRERFFNEIFEKMGEGDVKSELTFYRNLLDSANEYNRPWLPAFLKNEMDKEAFTQIVRHPVDNHVNLWRDFRLLRQVLKLEIGCSSDDVQNGLFVNVSRHMEEFLDVLFERDQEDFFRKSVQTLALMKIAVEACPTFAGYEGQISNFQKNDNDRVLHKINFLNLTEKTSYLMLKRENYRFVKKLQKSHPQSMEDNAFLIRYFSQDLFVSFVEMIKNSESIGPRLVPSTYDFLVSTPFETYGEITKVLDWLIEKPDKELYALARAWKALSSEGRLFLFNFLDSHYEKETNIDLLFTFYSGLLDVLKNPLSLFMENVFQKGEERAVVDSLTQITHHFSAPPLLEEFRRFFSREHILEVIQILSTGRVEEGGSLSLADYMIEPDGEERDVELNPSYIPISTSEKCLSELTRADVTLMTLVSRLPSDCVPYVEADPLFKALSAFNELGEYLYPLRPSLSRWPENSLFSGALIRNNSAVLKAISSHYGKGDEGISSVIQSIWSFLDDNKRRGNFTSLIGALPSLTEGERPVISTFSRFYGHEDNFPHLESLFQLLKVSLKEFDAYKKDQYESILTPPRFKQDSRYECKAFHHDVGGRPCPSKKDLLEISKRLVDRASDRYEGFPTALEQVLRMLSSDYGLAIPYQSEKKQRFKRVNLTESFEMFYHFTDPGQDINRFEFDYYPLPKADKEFFKKEDWEVDRKHLDKDVDSVKRTINTMERIEVVIRDVRFDQNYLGAHYLNSVAKAEDYNNVVETKYSLLEKCIPLKFCGKFMDKAQHRYAKNSEETFPALLDVNTHGDWRYGDYMQSLITAFVGSSSEKSQISTVINKRFFGLNIKIPWLLSKKTLRNHNGKMLGLISMVGMFTNSARVLRDRTGRSQEEFESFLNSDVLRKTDENLLKNYRPETHTEQVQNLAELILKNGFLEKFYDYVYSADYTTQRLWEGVVFKGLYLASFIDDKSFVSPYKDRYAGLSILDAIPLIELLLKHHKNLSESFSFGEKDFLLKVNHILDVGMNILEFKKEGDSSLTLAINELLYFVKHSEGALLSGIESIVSEPQKLNDFVLGLSSLDDFYSDLFQENKTMSVVEFLDLFINKDHINWTPYQQYLALNGSRLMCVANDGHVTCRKNPAQSELNKTLSYLLGEKSRRLLSLLEYLAVTQREKVSELLQKIFPSLVVK